MPGGVRHENGSQVVLRVADTRIHANIGNASGHANVSECWHCVYWAGQTKDCNLHAAS